jgi:histidine ammonia-lyase
MNRSTHCLDSNWYDLAAVESILEERPFLSLDEDVSRRIGAGARFVQTLAAGEADVYGVNTGFGSLCNTRVSKKDLETLQWNHIVSHAAGVGGAVSERQSRITMLVKLLTFRSGNTGITRETVQRILDMWAEDVISVIPKKGTVGASGDLAPLAHMALPLIGLGEVWIHGERVSGKELESRYGWRPLQPKAKEGLALTNGVQYITGIAINQLLRLRVLIDMADLVAALSAQAFSTSKTFFDPLYHTTSFHSDRKIVAANFEWATEGGNHYALKTAVSSRQDPYSFRCIPQVHGAIRQVYRFCARTIEDEMNGVSDNPLFFPDESVALFGGNLHGQSTAFALDFLTIAATELSSISERRGYQLQSGQRGLPDFLVPEPGLNSGLMIIQYTAAALVNENKTLSHPASVDSIPTCQLQEDHVSMGGTAGYKLEQVIDNLEYVLAIELMTAAQAVDLNADLKLSKVCEELWTKFREEVSVLKSDRILADDINLARSFVIREAPWWSRRIRAAVSVEERSF